MHADCLPTTQQGKLQRLVEECAEVTQVIMKIERFGFNPTRESTGVTYDNAADLRAELVDLRHAISQVEEFLA